MAINCLSSAVFGRTHVCVCVYDRRSISSVIPQNAILFVCLRWGLTDLDLAK